MNNTNDKRAAFQDFRDQRNKELAANGLDDQSNFWITNAHYTAWCRGIEWQSQQAQGEAAVNPEPWKDGWTEWWEGSDGWTHVKTNVLNRRLRSHPSAPAAVPDEALNIIEGIRAELTWGGWRKTSSRDWVMDMVSELLSMLTASPAPEHSGDGNEMVGWISVNEQTPSQGERVLLKIDLEDCPVVGYWGCGRYEACTVNMEVSCGAFCYGGNVDGSFSGEDVTHWMPLPNPPQQEEAER